MFQPSKALPTKSFRIRLDGCRGITAKPCPPFKTGEAPRAASREAHRQTFLALRAIGETARNGRTGMLRCNVDSAEKPKMIKNEQLKTPPKESSRSRLEKSFVEQL